MFLNNRLTKLAVGAGLGLYAAKKLDEKHHVVNDVAFIAKLVPHLRLLRGIEENNPGYCVPEMWEEQVDAHPDKVAVISTEDGRSFTFREVEERANQVAHWAIKNGYKCGDVVALFVENRPEFIFMQLGLAKIGVVVALINTNNKSRPLIHSIEVAQSKSLIFGTELSENVATVVDELIKDGIQFYSCHDPVRGGEPAFPHKSIDAELTGLPTNRPDKALRDGAGMNTSFGYIYTSGTTGLPKACVMKNSKYIFVAKGFGTIYKVTSDDVVYTCLPLYHSAGGMIGLGMLYGMGCTFVLSRKFSATNFFKECATHHATVTQYIGELARYLLNSPPNEWDKKHQIRVVVGNGMRGELW